MNPLVINISILQAPIVVKHGGSMKRKALEKACQKMTRSTIDNDKKYDRQLRCVAVLLWRNRKLKMFGKIGNDILK